MQAAHTIADSVADLEATSLWTFSSLRFVHVRVPVNAETKTKQTCQTRYGRIRFDRTFSFGWMSNGILAIAFGLRTLEWKISGLHNVVRGEWNARRGVRIYVLRQIRNGIVARPTDCKCNDFIWEMRCESRSARDQWMAVAAFALAKSHHSIFHSFAPRLGQTGHVSSPTMFNLTSFVSHLVWPGISYIIRRPHGSRDSRESYAFRSLIKRSATESRSKFGSCLPHNDFVRSKMNEKEHGISSTQQCQART